MTEFFAEKLQAPVEYFNPLRNVQAGPDAIPQGVAHCASGLGELVGCALRSLKNCPIEINLTPPSVRQAQRFAKRLPALAIAALFFILTPALCWIDMDESARRIGERVDKQTAEVARLDSLSKGISSALAERDKLVAEAAPFLAVAGERSAWASILDELAATIPQRFIWITQIKPVEGVILAPEPTPAPGAKAPPKPAAPVSGPKAITAIEINGLYLDNPPNSEGAGVIDKFFNNLKPSAVFAIGEDPSKIITRRTTPTGEAWAYGYTLVLPLKQPLVLP
jgi:hypothetical protein